MVLGLWGRVWFFLVSPPTLPFVRLDIIIGGAATKMDIELLRGYDTRGLQSHYLPPRKPYLILMNPFGTGSHFSFLKRSIKTYMFRSERVKRTCQTIWGGGATTLTPCGHEELFPKL